MEERDDAHTERSELKTNAHTYAHTEKTDDAKKFEYNEIKYPRKLRIHSRNRMQ